MSYRDAFTAAEMAETNAALDAAMNAAVKAMDDPYAKRGAGKVTVGDPYACVEGEDFSDYYRMIELQGADR